VADFRKALASDSIIIFDGAMGTLLQAMGLPAGASPELWGLANPQTVAAVHGQYLTAGARVVTTNTFGGSRFKLPPGTDVAALNREMAKVARQAAGDRNFVAGSVGPSGHFLEPLGPLNPRELVGAFKEQISGLAQGGVDLIVAETHFDLAEAKAVVLACREVCDLPVAVLMTFEPGGSLTGTSPEIFALTMRNLGVDLLGANCGLGPQQMLDVARDWGGWLDVPFFVKPNAGLPRLENGQTVYPMGPEEFAQGMTAFLDLGAKAVSGCCGTTPAHIAALAAKVSGRSWPRPAAQQGWLALTTRSASARIGVSLPAVCIGERINPTGKKILTEELQSGQFTQALKLAEEQIAAGAGVLDVNVGAPMASEEDLMAGLTKVLTARFTVPLCLDSTKISALAEGLWACPGSVLVNSISGEPGRMEELGPLCRRFGAPFILLPIAGKKLPVTAAERLTAIEGLLIKAEGLGIPRHLIMVDALALTVSSKPEAAKHCLETIRHCTQVWGLPTVLGLSNISFGLPARELINATFLAMCLQAGLTAHISNPSTPLARDVAMASEVLLARDPQAGRFIAACADWKSGGGSQTQGPGQALASPVETARQAVVRGAKEAVLALVEAQLASGRSAQAILNEDLIPAIMEVGEMYERREYFLPQLLLSAETMQVGFERLKPLLEAQAGAVSRPKVVLATVEGDIHDIGKNIVGLMLSNHGFEVLDLGKDVPALRIVEKAQEVGAGLIGLSALMTTTMVRMEDTLKLLRERGLPQKVMIGGAVVTEAFARAIGAHGHARDAVEAVRLAKRLVD
jgi:5-methyltetrahydrofolate--homocysteine methyltransferase